MSTIETTESLPDETTTKKRPRWGQILVWIGVFALLALVGAQLLRVQQGPVAMDKPVPDFTLNTFDGQQISLESLRGKVVVLNFWASWCKPCEQEAPDLEAAWRYYQPRGDVVFLGVDWTDTEKNGLAYLDKFDITYPNGPDLGTRISQAYRITGVPETYIIDQNGVLRDMKLLPFESLAEIQSMIDPLLEGK